MENLDFQNFARRTKFFTMEKSEEKSAKSHVVLAKEVSKHRQKWHDEDSNKIIFTLVSYDVSFIS